MANQELGQGTKKILDAIGKLGERIAGAAPEPGAQKREKELAAEIQAEARGEKKPVERMDEPGVTETDVGVTAPGILEPEEKVQDLTPEEQSLFEKRLGLKSGALDNPEIRNQFLGRARAFVGNAAQARDLLSQIEVAKLRRQLWREMEGTKDDYRIMLKRSLIGMQGGMPEFSLDPQMKPGVSGEAAKFAAGTQPAMQEVPEFDPSLEKALYQSAVSVVGGMFQSLSPSARKVATPSVAAAGAAIVGQTIQQDYLRNEQLVQSISTKNQMAANKWRGDVISALKDLDKAYNDAEKFAITSSLAKYNAQINAYKAQSERHNMVLTRANKFLADYSDLATSIDAAEFKRMERRQRTEEENAKLRQRHALAASNMAFKMAQDANTSGLFKVDQEMVVNAQMKGLSTPNFLAMVARSKDLTAQEFMAVSAESGRYVTNMMEIYNGLMEKGAIAKGWDNFLGFWGATTDEEKASIFMNNTAMLAGMGRFVNFTAMKPLLQDPDMKWNVDLNDVKILFPKEMTERMNREKDAGRTIFTTTHDDLKAQLPRALAHHARLMKKAKEIDEYAETPEEIKAALPADEAASLENVEMFLESAGVMERRVKRRGAMAKAVAYTLMQQFGSKPPEVKKED